GGTTGAEPAVIRTYAIHGASMEPTLHCAHPGHGCLARRADRVLAHVPAVGSMRGDIVVFREPIEALERCGTGEIGVSRLIGLPGEVVGERQGYIRIDGRSLREPYVTPSRRDREDGIWRVPAGAYFFMGDNRLQSCD